MEVLPVRRLKVDDKYSLSSFASQVHHFAVPVVQYQVDLAWHSNTTLWATLQLTSNLQVKTEACWVMF